MTNNYKYEIMKTNFKNNYNRLEEQLKSIKEQLIKAKQDDDSRKIDFYNNRVNSIMESLTNYKNILSFMRPNNE